MPMPNTFSRRNFLKSATGAVLGFPTLIPGRVRAQNAPSNRIQVGCIGVGRMGTGDLRDFLRFPEVRVVAVCDVDRHRAAAARRIVEQHEAESGRTADGACAEYGDFRELIARDDVDVVSIVTPDHWHALPALAAARAGKDFFIQKPLTYSIEEGRVLVRTVARYGNIVQVGSQQRSDAKFRFACQLVRNGRIGELRTVKVGFGTDPSTGDHPEMPVPANLNYDFWLGPAPWAPYTEMRVHPQNGYGRPGWLRIQEYCHGMITGWGSHHMDIAHWGMGMEHSGPTSIRGHAEYPASGLWTVHGKFHIEYSYPNGVQVICAGNDENKQGVVFEGSEGWVYVRRGFIDAHPKSLLHAEIPPDGIHLEVSNDHKGNFLQSVRTRKPTVAPAAIGHRSNTACVLGSIAMQLGRELTWDPQAEEFPGDPEANRMLSRPMRAPWRLT